MDFVELLISEVQKRPILWNKWAENYKNRLLADREWEKVAVALRKDSKLFEFIYLSDIIRI